MGRTYSVTFENVAVSAQQDLLEIKGASGKMLRILRIWVASVDSSLPTGQMLPLRARFLPATVTDGSGGSTPTPRRLDAGDSAASFTALANNTSQASSSGTAVVVEENGQHVFSPYDYAFPRPPVVGPSEAFTFELNGAPSGTIHLSGGALVEEIGG